MLDFIFTIIIATCGGFLFAEINAPLPWTLGPILAVAITSLFLKRQLHWPLFIRNLALIPLGYSMGRPFTVETGQAILNQLPFMLLATFVTISAGIFSAWLMCRHTKINFTSCLLGCVPGGLSQMVILAAEMKEADLTAVTIMQTLRMLSVVFVIPFLVIHVLPAADSAAPIDLPPASNAFSFFLVAVSGALIGKFIKLPTAPLLGPLLATAIFIIIAEDTAPLIPVHYLNAAQICVGSYIGSSIDLRKLREYHGMGPVLIGSVLFVLAISMGMGVMLALLTPSTIVTTFLATAPGGLAEMGITALVVGADSSTMTAYQLTRLLFIMLCYPLIVRWILAHYQQK
ncbi:MAG: AbrB family transcriptional regulator [Selenomonas sp.]|uniref:AbrB family transcriptional regulator n=1 Tax=Selenomonas sp. TaxID=2053611 RepID=UPI0025D26CCB|nr:AbrB family transcriptional regulator [Selenomonas sp.]MCR5757819.1 AbrB family transcriptional regulator [Selenomonas sp.]